MDTSIRIQRNKLKQLGLLIGCIAFVVAGYLMVTGFFKGNMSEIKMKTFGVLGIVFFGPIGLFKLFNFITSKPALLINQEGIRNYSHFGSGYLIPWQNLKYLNIISIKNQRIIEIGVHNPEEIYEQVSFLSRKLMKSNERYMDSPAYIPTSVLSMPLEEVIEIIHEQKKIYVKG